MNKFAIGDKVTFKRDLFTGPYAQYFMSYQGHTFEVVGFMPDTGYQIDLETGTAIEFKNDGFVFDHIGLKCITGNVQVAGYVHDHDLEHA